MVLASEASKKMLFAFYYAGGGEETIIFKVIKCVGFGGLEFDICLFFLLSPSDDPIVSSLVKHKEFDELVHWHSHRPLSDDYDRTRANFNGELTDSAKLISIYITLAFISK